jgi:hypothetical protein
MTPLGIDSTTFLFVAQCLNHCATAYPILYIYQKKLHDDDDDDDDNYNKTPMYLFLILCSFHSDSIITNLHIILFLSYSFLLLVGYSNPIDIFSHCGSQNCQKYLLL